MRPLRPGAALPFLLPVALACGAAPPAPEVGRAAPPPPSISPADAQPVAIPAPPPPPAPLRDGDVVANLPPSEMSGARFAPGTHFFTTCSERGTVELREGAQGLLLRAERVTHACRDAAFVPASGRLWALSDTGDVSSYRIGEPARERLVHLEGISQERDSFDGEARLADDGSAVLGRSEAGLTVWTLPEGRRAFTVPEPCQERGTAQGFGKDRAVIMACSDGTVARFDGKSGAPAGRWKAPMAVTYFGEGESITGLSWNPGAFFVLGAGGSSSPPVGVNDETGGAVSIDGAYVAAHGGGRLSLWNVATARQVGSVEVPAGNFAVANDGSTVVDGNGRLWHPGSPAPSALLGIGHPAGRLQSVGGLGVEHARRCAACGDVTVTRLGDGQTAPVPSSTTADRIAERSSDGERVLVDVDSQGTTFSVRTLQGKELGVVERPHLCVHCGGHSEIAWNRGLHVLVKATMRSVEPDPESRAPPPPPTVRFELQDLHGASGTRVLAGGATPEFSSLSVAEDGSRIVTWGRGQAALWDGRSGKRVATFPIDDTATTASLLEDGSALLVGGYDGRVSRVELPSGRSAPLFDGAARAELRGAVTTLLPLPGGTRLIVGDARGQNDVWDLKAGKRVGTVYAFADGAWAARDASGALSGSEVGLGRFHLVNGTTAGPISPEAKVTRVAPARMMELLGVK